MQDWHELLSEEAISTLRHGIQPRLRLGESFEAAMDTTFAVAQIRAEHFHREVIPLDVEVVAAGLCWWPMKPDMGVGYVSAAAAERQELIETHRTGIDVQAHIRRELLEFQIIQPLIDLPAEEVMEHLRFQSVNEMEFGIVEVAEAASSDEDSGSPEAPA